MNDIETLRDQIKDVKIAMLTTSESDGSLRSRPMGTQEVEFDGDLWFFTGEDSGKSDEISKNPQVNVSYADPGSSRFVSVTGTAALVHDKAKAKQFWSPAFKIWFPNGIDDPNLALLKVSVKKAEYWDAPHGKLVQLIGFAKAVATGDHEIAGSRHEKITLK